MCKLSVPLWGTTNDFSSSLDWLIRSLFDWLVDWLIVFSKLSDFFIVLEWELIIRMWGKSPGNSWPKKRYLNREGFFLLICPLLDLWSIGICRKPSRVITKKPAERDGMGSRLGRDCIRPRETRVSCSGWWTKISMRAYDCPIRIQIVPLFLPMKPALIQEFFLFFLGGKRQNR